MDKPKLNKAQEKRFEKLLEIIFSKHNVNSPSMDRASLKQHLADELALQKKESYEEGYKDGRHDEKHGIEKRAKEHIKKIDQAIKSIKEKGK